MNHGHFSWILVLALCSLAACGDDADDLGVGAECNNASDCGGEAQQCLTPFKPVSRHNS